MLKIHLDLFDQHRQTVFDKLSAFKRYGYLAGGTALALQLNHRISYDFDVFVSDEIGNSLRQKIRSEFGEVSYSLNTNDQINFETNEHIKVTFFWYYFPTFTPLVETKSISLASIADIACDKAHTIGRRAVWRDYVDMYWLLSAKKTTLHDVIKNAKCKFKGEFVPTLFLEQLVYFADIQVVPIEFIDHVATPDTVQTFLKKEVANYLKIALP
jgi:hypothetical protein